MRRIAVVNMKGGVGKSTFFTIMVMMAVVTTGMA